MREDDKMQLRRHTVAGVVSALLVLWTRLPASAGVVIQQDVTIPDAGGGSKKVTHTTMIEGNRLKLVSPQGGTIMDLDKGTFTILDAKNQTATEMPISGIPSPMASTFTGRFEPTGGHKTIAGYPCDEYRHEFKSAAGTVSSLTCISKQAPGAAEAAAFYKNMAAKLGGHDVSQAPEGIPLSEEATVKPSAMPLPDLPPEVAKKIAEAQAKQPPRTTEAVVTSVKAEKFSADTFAVPQGYTVKKLDPEAMREMGGMRPSATPAESH
jgi:hypothetical protein